MSNAYPLQPMQGVNNFIRLMHYDMPSCPVDRQCLSVTPQLSAVKVNFKRWEFTFFSMYCFLNTHYHWKINIGSLAYGLRGIKISPLQVMLLWHRIYHEEGVAWRYFPKKSYMQDVGHTTGCVLADKIQPERSQNCNSNKQELTICWIYVTKTVFVFNINK